MIHFPDLKDQTMNLRAMIAKLLDAAAPKADVIPPGWKNNARWHAGHLVITPRLLTFGLLGRPLGVPDEYRKWFSKGTSPADWSEGNIPDYSELMHQMILYSKELFAAIEPIQDDPFPNPYATSVGVTLHTPAQALQFSMAHDGIHLGLLLALKRALG